MAFPYQYNTIFKKQDRFKPDLVEFLRSNQRFTLRATTHELVIC